MFSLLVFPRVHDSCFSNRLAALASFATLTRRINTGKRVSFLAELLITKHPRRSSCSNKCNSTSISLLPTQPTPMRRPLLSRNPRSSLPSSHLAPRSPVHLPLLRLHLHCHPVYPSINQSANRQLVQSATRLESTIMLSGICTRVVRVET